MSKLKLFTFLTFLFTTILSAQNFEAGNTYFDATGFVEYRAGNLPVIISVPHGGTVAPGSIPDRSYGTFVMDSWTKPIGEGIYDEIVAQTGCYPHVIINLLHRRKFDANRDIDEAADGNYTVEQAWYNYHAFIDSSKNKAIQDYGRGLFIDLHGHGHPIERIELGYLLSIAELQLSDLILNNNFYIEESSIRTLVGDNLQGLTHLELLRGIKSLGSILHDKGFPSVPSVSDPFPLFNEPFFIGGYNTQRHGSRDNAGDIDAIQIELNQDIRFDASIRAMLIDSLAASLNEYIDYHYYNQYSSEYCNLNTVHVMDEKAETRINSLYPNPSKTGIIFMDYYSTVKTEIPISVYDLKGSLITSQFKEVGLGGNNLQLDFSSLQKGIYFIKIGTETRSSCQKIIID